MCADGGFILMPLDVLPGTACDACVHASFLLGTRTRSPRRCGHYWRRTRRTSWPQLGSSRIPSPRSALSDGAGRSMSGSLSALAGLYTKHRIPDPLLPLFTYGVRRAASLWGLSSDPGMQANHRLALQLLRTSLRRQSVQDIRRDLLPPALCYVGSCRRCAVAVHTGGKLPLYCRRAPSWVALCP